MKKGLRLQCIGGPRPARQVFTRALMKKGLRRLTETNSLSAQCFHACPDEEGITTRPFQVNEPGEAGFHACPDEEGITTPNQRHCESPRVSFHACPDEE